MAKKYDAIVVGAGPAGLVAARALGENGFDVALVESKDDISKLTRACAQTLDSPNEYLHNELFRCNVRDKRLSFPAHGFSVKYDGPYANVWGTYVYSPGGIRIQLGVAEEQKKKGDYGKTIPIPDKEILFRCLLDEARSFNVEVFTGVLVQKVTTSSEGVKVEGSGRSFEGFYLIAADGLNSRIAEMMGFNRDRTYYGNLRAVVHYMSGLELPSTDVSYHIYGFPKGGPAQLFIFPRPAENEEYIFGLATMHPAVDLQEATEHFTKKAFCAPWFKNAKIVRSFSAVCNNRTPVFEPYKNRVLLTGDAAFT
ncbi:MAG: NAD(P)/FAD-dependent oxidoreductase, partial [Dehalococcoidia bacterium]|nr:NAD(P)/FAD-dependent oxidoreductase [Dehalococcoidia bacterium]